MNSGSVKYSDARRLRRRTSDGRRRTYGVLTVDGKTFYNISNFKISPFDDGLPEICSYALEHPEFGIDECFAGKPYSGELSVKIKEKRGCCGFWFYSSKVFSLEDAVKINHRFYKAYSNRTSLTDIEYYI